MDKINVHQLLETENDQLNKLQNIVLKAIEEEKLISQKLYDFEEPIPDFGKRLADAVAEFGGSWRFIIIFGSSLLLWIVLNTVVLHRAFDPYPYILLNLILSTIAAIQAPVIMMSQNRKEVKDRQRAINDYLINLKAEIEIRNMHEKIDLLIAEQMKSLFDIQKLQMDLMEDIGQKLNKS